MDASNDGNILSNDELMELVTKHGEEMLNTVGIENAVNLAINSMNYWSHVIQLAGSADEAIFWHENAINSLKGEAKE